MNEKPTTASCRSSLPALSSVRFALALFVSMPASAASIAPAVSPEKDALLLGASGPGFTQARADVERALAREISWPKALPLPAALAQKAFLLQAKFNEKSGALELSASASRREIAATLESLVASESAALTVVLSLWERAIPERRLEAFLSLREAREGSERMPLGALVSSCRMLGACAQGSSEPATKADAVLAQSTEEADFLFAPEDALAADLLDPIDAAARSRGLRVREPSVTNPVRQLKTRCQKIVFPRVGTENIRLVELTCEADALVKGERVATLRFVGRGQDVTPDDAEREAQRRFVVEDLAFVGKRR